MKISSTFSLKQQDIVKGTTYLGIELGSTRIKACLIDSHYEILAEGVYQWENQYVDGFWTYDLDLALEGVRAVFKQVSNTIKTVYDVDLTRVASIGISAMMHGYLAFDANNNLLVPFRTWRNTNTTQAHEVLSTLLDMNIPERWSIAHLYQSLLNNEAHVGKIAYITTLAGYIHFKLTGKKVLGVSDASGMFPIDPETLSWDADALKKLETLAELRAQPWKLSDILPEPLVAGSNAGTLTQQGAHLLDPSGMLQATIPLVPPEGDAATGMAATNAVKAGRGNVSAGTSIFATIVLHQALQRSHPELDMVMTPTGRPAAMSHANNFTTDLNAWAGLFAEFAKKSGVQIDAAALYQLLLNPIIDDDVDAAASGSVNYCFSSGEYLAGLKEGRLVFARSANAKLTLGNFMRAQLFGAFCPVRIGMNVLIEEEKATIDMLVGHGGIFATPRVAQQIMAAAFNTAVTTMQTAAGGGAWGMALLAAYALHAERSLEDFLDHDVFGDVQSVTVLPNKRDVEGFNQYFKQFIQSLPIEHAAIETIPQ